MRRTVYSILAGLSGGVVMALVMLYSMNASGLMMRGLTFVLALVIAAGLPLCMYLFSSNENVNVILTQSIMILVSFVITIIYAFYITGASELARSYSSNVLLVSRLSAVLHGISLLCSLLVYFVKRRNKNGKIQ